VKLDLSVEGRWFVEYQNGSIAYSLPTEWHATVNGIYRGSSSSLYHQSRPQPIADMSPIIAPQSTTIDILPTTAQAPLTTVELLPTIDKVPLTTVEVTVDKVPFDEVPSTTSEWWRAGSGRHRPPSPPEVTVLQANDRVPLTTAEVTVLQTTIEVLPATDKVPSTSDSDEVPITTARVALPSDSLARLCNVLGEDKIPFLNDLEASIHAYIVGTGRQCIAVVQKIPNRGTTDDDPASEYTLCKYELNMNDLGSFVKVLFKFMTKKRHNGHELDSALTVPVLDIVQRKFMDLYEARRQQISHELLRALRTDDFLLECFIRRLSDVVSTRLSREAQRQIVHLIAHEMNDAHSSHATHVIGDRVAHFATTTVGTRVAMMAAKVLIHALGTNIGHVILKFLSSAAFKKLLYALLRKKAMFIIASAVVKFLALTFGGTVGAGAISFVIFPVMAGILYKQMHGFPKKLGKEVSKSVRNHLSLEFEGMNRKVLSDTFEKIFEGRELLEAVAEDPNIHEMFHNLSQEFH